MTRNILNNKGPSNEILGNLINVYMSNSSVFTITNKDMKIHIQIFSPEFWWWNPYSLSSPHPRVQIKGHYKRQNHWLVLVYTSHLKLLNIVLQFCLNFYEEVVYRMVWFLLYLQLALTCFLMSMLTCWPSVQSFWTVLDNYC